MGESKSLTHGGCNIPTILRMSLGLLEGLRAAGSWPPPVLATRLIWKDSPRARLLSTWSPRLPKPSGAAAGADLDKIAAVVHSSDLDGRWFEHAKAGRRFG